MNNSKKVNVAAFVLAAAAVFCFPQILNSPEDSLTFTNSIASMLMWGLCFHTLRCSIGTIDFQDRRGFWISNLFALLFTLAMLFGVRLDRMQNVDYMDVKL